MPKILIFQACPIAIEDEYARIPGGRSNTALFTDALNDGLAQLSGSGHRADALETFTLNVGDLETLPQGLRIADFDGVVLTGSPHNAYKDEPPVRHQIGLAREVYHSGVPSFGSCWGLQIMSAALGGKVRLNPNGREFGVARAIYLTDKGRSHALFKDKPPGFDALCSHEDEVETLPPNATLLASNAMSEVQAIEVADGEKSFWGVQYHPEMDFGIAAALMKRRTARQISDGYATSREDVDACVADFLALGADQPPPSLVWRYGLTPQVTDASARRREFRNWLATKVYPSMSARR